MTQEEFDAIRSAFQECCRNDPNVLVVNVWFDPKSGEMRNIIANMAPPAGWLKLSGAAPQPPDPSEPASASPA